MIQTITVFNLVQVAYTRAAIKHWDRQLTSLCGYKHDWHSWITGEIGTIPQAVGFNICMWVCGVLHELTKLWWQNNWGVYVKMGGYVTLHHISSSPPPPHTPTHPLSCSHGRFLSSSRSYKGLGMRDWRERSQRDSCESTMTGALAR